MKTEENKRTKKANECKRSNWIRIDNRCGIVVTGNGK
jgi:hypothetical protein